jgi:hypothetical protein
MKILLSLSEELLKDVDLYCEKYRFSRSEFFRNLIRQKLFGEKELGKTGEQTPDSPRPSVEKLKQLIPEETKPKYSEELLRDYPELRKKSIHIL